MCWVDGQNATSVSSLSHCVCTTARAASVLVYFFEAKTITLVLQ